MFKNKIFFSFLFISSLNIFGMHQIGNSYELRINHNSSSNNNRPSNNNAYTKTFFNGNGNFSISQNNQRSHQAIQNQIEQQANLRKSYLAFVIEARAFPEIGEMINTYQKKGVHCNYLNEQMKSLSEKYKSLILEDGRINENFSNLSAKDLVARIISLEKEKYKLDNSVNACGPSMCKKIFDKAKKSEKITVLNKLLDQRRECAKCMAQSSIISSKLLQANVILKEKNSQNFQKAEEFYKKITTENSKQETLSTDDISHQEMAKERANIAKKICAQVPAEQCKDRTFDTSGISLEFLKTNGYNQNDISQLKGANDLQDFLQNNFIDQIKENQNFKQEHSDKKFLSSLTSLHEKYIQNGLTCNKDGDTTKAMTYSDLCWRTAKGIKTFAKTLANLGDVSLETIHTLDEITYDATKTFLDAADKWTRDFFTHSDEHIVQLIEGALDGAITFAKIINKGLEAIICYPEQTIKKCLGIAYVLTNKATAITTKCINFCDESLNNPVASKEKIQTLKYDVLQFLDDVGDNLSETNKLAITRALGEFIASGYLTGEAIKFAGEFLKIIGTEIFDSFKAFIKETLEIKSPAPVVATTNGLILPMEGFKNTVQNGAKVAENTLIDGERIAIDEIKKTYNIAKTIATKGEQIIEYDGIESALVKPLEIGSTGRTVANNLEEQLAMKEVMSNPYPDPDPTKGFTVLSEKGFKMTDPRWPAEEGWEKVSKEINTVRLGGEKIKIEIHYLWNKTLNIYDDFKFKS